MRRILAFVAAAVLSAALMPVLAQQAAPAGPAQDASAPKPPPTPMISRWVDAKGRVHYGDALPPDAPEQTTEVGPIQSATPEQKEQADARMQQYRSYLNPPPAAAQADADHAPDAPRQPDDDNSCAGQWARFNAAAACANQYRVAGGGLKQDVAQHCPVVPQPQCAPAEP
ncbi:MAG: DUF4124 domain-containing protein [Burkholderiaceae bacterium]|nr:DUF4124 domain-containing protein [Burkholderiaceae bacterium]